MIQLTTVMPTNDNHARILYRLLEQRKPTQNISHTTMPTWEEHTKFIQSVPYKGWFLVIDIEKDWIVGAVYMTRNNEIGIGILEEYQGQGYGKEAVLAIMNKYPPPYYANINPANDISIRMFSELGFNLLQVTLCLK